MAEHSELLESQGELKSWDDWATRLVAELAAANEKLDRITPQLATAKCLHN